jgi:hypothetical protein
MADIDFEKEIDRLYGLPLDEFIAQRDALAKQLRAAGEREGAAAVKALRKPTAGAWALNQAVRRRRAETEELVAAGERLREAHAALLSGGGRDDLRAALAEQRKVAGVLADCAETIASETGRSGPALKERVRATLHAVALDDEVREALTRGRLVREREAVGLGAEFAPAAVSTSAPSRSRDRAPAAGRRAREADRKKAERERKEAEAARQHAETALRETEAALREAENAHEDAASRVDAARAELSAGEDAEREARRRVREMRKQLARRERELRRTGA